MNKEKLAEILVRLVPEWGGREISWARASEGYMHETYFADSGGDSVVLKILDETMLRDFLHSDPRAIVASTRLAGDIGVAPPVLGASHDPSCMVFEFLSGRCLDPVDLATKETLERVVATVRTLHEQTRLPPNEADPFEHGNRCALGLEQLDSPWSQNWLELIPRLSEVERALGAREARQCFTHNDLYWENILADGDRIYFIDYDRAGAGDPAYDLGEIVAEHDLSPTAQEWICQAYFGREDNRDLAVLRLASTASDFVQGAAIAFALAKFPDRYAPIAVELEGWVRKKLDAASVAVERSDFAADLRLAAKQAT